MWGKYKKDILWILITLLLVIFLNITYMYSRDKTLSTVEKNEFKLFTNIMYTSSLNHKNFSQMSNALTIIPKSSNSKKRQALFHIALITKNGCIENAFHERNKPLLCETFKTNNIIKKIIKGKTTKYIYKGQEKESFEYSPQRLGIDEPHYECYMIKKRKHSNKWIIAKKRYLQKNSELHDFFFFITHRYLNTTSIASKFRHTDLGTYIVFIVSFLLWLLFKSRERKNTNKYKSLMVESHRIKSEIVEKDSKYNILKNQIYMIEEKIRDDEVKLTSNIIDNLQDKKRILERIRKKTIQQTQLYQALNKLRDEIINLEARGEALLDILDERRAKLNTNQRNIEYQKLVHESKALKQLWRHEPTWMQRQHIEKKVSLAKDKIPFTVAQAFTAFERYIDDEIEKYFNGKELEEALDKTLIKKIRMITDYKNMSQSEQTLYHEIRIARNKWVHGAIYPSKELFEKLLSLLEKTYITPSL